MTIMCRQRRIREKICPHEQSQLQTRKSKLNQPLRRKTSNSHSNVHLARLVNNITVHEKDAFSGNVVRS